MKAEMTDLSKQLKTIQDANLKEAAKPAVKEPHVQDHALVLKIRKLFRRPALRDARGGLANFNVLNGGHFNLNAEARRTQRFAEKKKCSLRDSATFASLR